jgi:hypothetical protein
MKKGTAQRAQRVLPSKGKYPTAPTVWSHTIDVAAINRPNSTYSFLFVISSLNCMTIAGYPSKHNGMIRIPWITSEKLSSPESAAAAW